MSKRQEARVFRQLDIFFSGQHSHFNWHFFSALLFDYSVSRLLFVGISMSSATLFDCFQIIGDA